MNYKLKAKANLLGEHFCKTHGINPENSINISKVNPKSLLSYKHHGLLFVHIYIIYFFLLLTEQL